MGCDAAYSTAILKTKALSATGDTITGCTVNCFNTAFVVVPIAKTVVSADNSFREKKLFTAVGLKNNMASGRC